MRRSKKGCVLVWMTVLVMLMVGGANGRLVLVGGKYGWNQGINYTLWAFNETLYIGDWLYFRFEKNYYDVLEVNQTNYETCNSDNFIANITRGSGRDVYELKEARSYYFICSKGYCYGGMKLAIDVKNSSPPASPPQGNNAVASSLYSGSMISFMPVFLLVISIMVFLPFA